MTDTYLRYAFFGYRKKMIVFKNLKDKGYTLVYALNLMSIRKKKYKHGGHLYFKWVPCRNMSPYNFFSKARIPQNHKDHYLARDFSSSFFQEHFIGYLASATIDILTSPLFADNIRSSGLRPISALVISDSVLVGDLVLT